MGWIVFFLVIWLMFVYVLVVCGVWLGWIGDFGMIDYVGGVVI